MAKGLFNRIETAYNDCKPLKLRPGDVATIYHILMEMEILGQDKFENIAAQGYQRALYLQRKDTPIKNRVDKS